MNWVNGKEFFPPDWKQKHLRLVCNQQKINADDFDLWEGNKLRNINRPGDTQPNIQPFEYLWLAEIEWLEEIMDVPFEPTWRPLHAINKLERGDLVRHKGNRGNSYLIDFPGGDFAIAVDIKHITNPIEWEVFK